MPALSGVIPPIITPLTSDRQVDTGSLRCLVAAMATTGIQGLLVLGSTGEGAHLLADEQDEVVATAVAAAGELPVVANAVADNTRAAAAAAARFKQAGAHTILAPPPLAFGLSQQELASHFEAVADAAGEPVLAYHVPSRVPTPVTADLVGELVRRGVLTGIKDSSGDLEAHRRTTMAVAGTDATLLTGSEGGIDLAFMAGFSGSIPGLANIYPVTEVALCEAAAAGRWAQAKALQEELVRRTAVYFGPVGASNFSATAVGSLKYALASAGVIASPALTVPFLDLNADARAYVDKHLAGAPVEVPA